ncbi:ThiF family adenylyltransferase [Salisediminibacterium selenitireducens]|uniref:UBA/THIF-type NAD/FAD binding protein n=1 Tax=Bacillus selenitireducens (strain ATCC 700615 / DSM 15326 / MLS10) TaxID=439292 RepID=D6XYB8_BACIE|nr:ThiF family adenylyltransferase [Salisediminibacterium selenitireducens]ADI00187.1 UBA/THIF-type NAD/FAD binding protein [[Bacillus] selenitireducens MLS10]
MTARYSRQERFEGIGHDGQAKIRDGSVMIAGAGALGSAAAEMFVRAGVGRVLIVDRDYVEHSNLQRQQLYTEQDAHGRLPKAVAAERRLRSINGDVTITGLTEEITPVFLAQMADVDAVVDGLDNFETRMAINDACMKRGIPFIYGACVASGGLSYTVLPEEKPCLQCILGDAGPGGETCDTAGIISPAVQMTASFQTAEALKLLSGNREALREELVEFDVWSNETRKVNVTGLKDPGCPSCGPDPKYPNLDRSAQTKTAVLCGRDTVQIRPHKAVSFERVRHDLPDVPVSENPFLMQLELEGRRVVLFRDGRALVHNTSDPVEALSLYQRYIGS